MEACANCGRQIGNLETPRVYEHHVVCSECWERLKRAKPARGARPAKESRRRLSLTKTQVEGGPGAELLALCQSVTADGVLSKEDIIALRYWLKAHQSSELPAISFLSSTLTRIIADGKVTREEQRELYNAVESILPPEARKSASEHRKMVESREKAVERSQRAAEQQEQREERERQRPLGYANFMVAGVRYEGRGEIIRKYVREDEQVFLARDRANRYSRNAIEVRLSNGMQIGFVPEDDAEELAPLLDQGCAHQAYVTKILAAAQVPIPVVQARLYRADAGIDGAVLEAAVPTKKIERSKKRSGCLSSIAIALLLFGLCYASLLYVLKQ